MKTTNGGERVPFHFSRNELEVADAHEASERPEAGMVWNNNPMIDNDACALGSGNPQGLGAIWGGCL